MGVLSSSVNTKLKCWPQDAFNLQKGELTAHLQVCHGVFCLYSIRMHFCFSQEVYITCEATIFRSCFAYFIFKSSWIGACFANRLLKLLPSILRTVDMVHASFQMHSAGICHGQAPSVSSGRPELADQQNSGPIATWMSWGFSWDKAMVISHKGGILPPSL